MKYGLLGTNLWTWILIIVYPLYELSTPSDNMNSSNSFYSDSKLNESVNAASIAETLETFFQPFLVEFLTIFAGCLLTLWQTMRYDHDDPRSLITDKHVRQLQRSEETINTNYGDILHNDCGEAQQRLTQNDVSNKRSEYLVAILSVLIAGTYLIAAEMLSAGPLSYISEHLKDTTRVSYRKIIQTGVYTPLLFMNIISLWKLRKDSNIMPTQSSLTSSGYLLLFTSGAHFVYCVWRLAANIGLLGFPQELGICTNLFYIFSTVTAMTEVWIQTQHIMTVNYIHRSGRKIPKMSKLILIYLMSLNLADWMYLSLSHKWAEHSHDSVALSPEISIFFGHYNTKLLILLSNPILEMYLFHSAMMACECLHDDGSLRSISHS